MTQTVHVVQAFQQEEFGYVPLPPRTCQSAAQARAVARQLAPTHAGVIAWSRSGDPDTGEWEPAEELARFGVIPEEFEVGGGVE